MCLPKQQFQRRPTAFAPFKVKKLAVFRSSNHKTGLAPDHRMAFSHSQRAWDVGLAFYHYVQVVRYTAKKAHRTPIFMNKSYEIDIEKKKRTQNGAIVWIYCSRCCCCCRVVVATQIYRSQATLKSFLSLGPMLVFFCYFYMAIRRLMLLLLLLLLPS